LQAAILTHFLPDVAVRRLARCRGGFQTRPYFLSGAGSSARGWLPNSLCRLL